MYLKIAKEKVKYEIPMLNGEPLLIKIENVEENVREETITITTGSTGTTVITEITGTTGNTGTTETIVVTGNTGTTETIVVTGNTGTTKISRDIRFAQLKIGTHVESNYLSSDEPYNGIIDGLAYSINLDLTELDANGNIISEKKSYDTTLIKLLKEKVKTTLSLTDDDLNVLAEVEWRNEPQTIRLTIPVVEVIENSYYRGLMDSLITANVIRYKVGDYYILYLSYIEDEHRAILEADENILIEE